MNIKGGNKVKDDIFDFYVSKISFVINKLYDVNPCKNSPYYDSKTDMIKTHYSEFVLSLCTEGEGLYVIDGKEYTVKEGDLSFFPKNQTRAYKNAPNKNWGYISVSFDMEYINSNETVTLENVGYFTESVPLEIQSLFRKTYSEWSGCFDGYKLKCRTNLQEILIWLTDTNAKKTCLKNYSQIADAQKYIQSHIKEEIDFNKLISDSNLSPTHFRRLFKKYIGYSPREYYNYIKIKQSADMLKTGIFSVSDVAWEMGYGSVYYFSAVFKKYYKTSPSKYMKY